jgi:hypothetical protein
MQTTIARFATALVLMSTGFVQAQSSVDSRWSAWLGCWRTADADASTTCVIPTARSSAVDVVTIVNGEIDSRTRIDADGQPHAIDRAGCHGAEVAVWSPTGRRVYRRDELVCPAGVNGTATTLMSISPSGDWLNIEGVRAGAGSLQRLDRFHDVGLPTTIPKEVRTAITLRQLASSTARAAAAAPITEADVLEANANVDPVVVRSWLAEAGAGVAVVAVASPPQQSVPMTQEMAAPAPQYDSNCNSGACYDSNCNPAGCYQNPYSPYNGYSMYPYGPYSSVFGSPFGFGFGAPLIIGSVSHRPRGFGGHQFPPRHQPPHGQPMRPMQPQAPRHEPARFTAPVRARP